jgi:hypothetical protein
VDSTISYLKLIALMSVTLVQTLCCCLEAALGKIYELQSRKVKSSVRELTSTFDLSLLTVLLIHRGIQEPNAEVLQLLAPPKSVILYQ